MLLTINIGNTNILSGVFDGETLARTERFPVSDTARLETFLASYPRVEAVVTAGVNPHAAQGVFDTARRVFRCPVLMAGRDLRLPVRNLTRFPERVGIDRLLNAIAAYRRAAGPCIIIDVGTAVTVDAVDNAGGFLGGAIIPGPSAALSALHAHTALLPKIDMPRDIPVLGTDTEGAMSSGVFWGTIGAIEKITEMLKREAAGSVTFLTGGGAQRFAQHITGMDHAVPALILEGMRLAYLAR